MIFPKLNVYWDFAADQRRDRYLAAHLDQERLEVFITEKILRYRNLRR